MAKLSALFALAATTHAAPLITCSVTDRASGQIVGTQSAQADSLACFAPDHSVASISSDPRVGAGVNGVRSWFDMNVQTVSSATAYDVIVDFVLLDEASALLVAVGGTGPALLDLGQPSYSRDASGSVTYSPVPTDIRLDESLAVGTWPGPQAPGLPNCPVTGPTGNCYLPITFGVPFPVSAGISVTAHTSTSHGYSFSTVEEIRIVAFGGIVDPSFRPIRSAQLTAIPEPLGMQLAALGAAAVLVLRHRARRVTSTARE